MSNTQSTDRHTHHNGETLAAKGPRKHLAQNIAEPITVPELVTRLLKEEKEREIKGYAERLRAEILEDMAAAKAAA